MPAARSGKGHVATSGWPGHRGADCGSSASSVITKSAEGAPRLGAGRGKRDAGAVQGANRRRMKVLGDLPWLATRRHDELGGAQVGKTGLGQDTAQGVRREMKTMRNRSLMDSLWAQHKAHVDEHKKLADMEATYRKRPVPGAPTAASCAARQASTPLSVHRSGRRRPAPGSRCARRSRQAASPHPLHGVPQARAHCRSPAPAP